MALNDVEKQIVEAVETMLRHDFTILESIDTMVRDGDKLGLAFHKDVEETSHMAQFLHEEIQELFELKNLDSKFHDSLTSAFRKVHGYKYIDDPSFVEAFHKELIAQGVPGEERSKAVGTIPVIIKELSGSKPEEVEPQYGKTMPKQGADWSEKDAGVNTKMDEIRKASQPEQFEK